MHICVLRNSMSFNVRGSLVCLESEGETEVDWPGPHQAASFILENLFIFRPGNFLKSSSLGREPVCHGISYPDSAHAQGKISTCAARFYSTSNYRPQIQVAAAVSEWSEAAQGVRGVWSRSKRPWQILLLLPFPSLSSFIYLYSRSREANANL